MSVVHIVFTPSGADCLQIALEQDGRNERVIGLWDCLSLGPIDPPDPQTRAKWILDELGETDWEETVRESERFWKEAFPSADRKIAWVSRRSTREYTGFLEWLWRLGDAPAEIVDLTDTMVMQNWGNGPAIRCLARSLSLVSSPEVIRANDLWQSAQEITPTLRNTYHELWRRLRAENAPLRVLDENGLSSAPVSYFDGLLMDSMITDWWPSARTIGNVLGVSSDTGLFQVEDPFLMGRIRALAAAGLIEARGDLSHMRTTQVRRLS